MSLRDWGQHPLDNGFYEHIKNGTLLFIKKDKGKYYISGVDEEERELTGTPEQCFMMKRVCPHDYMERMHQKVRETQDFVNSRSGGGS